MANCISCGSPDFYDSGFSAECVNSSCRLFSQKHKDAVYGNPNATPDTKLASNGHVYHLPSDTEEVFIHVNRGGAWIKSTLVYAGSTSYSQTYVRRSELFLVRGVSGSLDVEVSPDGETDFTLSWFNGSSNYDMRIVATDVFYLVSTACTNLAPSP